MSDARAPESAASGRVKAPARQASTSPASGASADRSATATAPEALDLVIVSDLHMAAGRDPASGRSTRTEDFHRDAAFAGFIRARVRQGAERGRPWRLIALGDLFDFTRVELGRLGDDRRRLDTSVPAALLKLDRIASGHSDVFAAFRELLQAGAGLHVVPGNHDLELLKPPVQRRLRELLVEPEGRAGEITFHPWMLCVPGVLYAEHGEQHHDINAIPRLAEAAEGSLEAGLEAPLGSHLGEWLTALIDAADPDVERLDPGLTTLVAALRGRPLAVLAAWRAHATFLRALLRHWTRAGRAAGRAARRNVAEPAVIRRANAVGLSPVAIASIDHLTDLTLAGTARRLARMAIASRARRPARPAEPPPGYMRLAAAAIHRILRGTGDEVPFYVFGHTHAAERSELEAEGARATYLNSGTWSQLVRGEAGLPTFVEVGVDPTGPATARLLAWDAARGQAMPIEASRTAV